MAPTPFKLADRHIEARRRAAALGILPAIPDLMVIGKPGKSPPDVAAAQKAERERDAARFHEPQELKPRESTGKGAQGRAPAEDSAS